MGPPAVHGTFSNRWDSGGTTSLMDTSKVRRRVDSGSGVGRGRRGCTHSVEPTGQPTWKYTVSRPMVERR